MSCVLFIVFNFEAKTLIPCQFRVILIMLDSVLISIITGSGEGIKTMTETLKGIAPIKRNKVSDTVVEAVEKLIISNKLKPGDGLPSEKSLSESLAVGTRSVREALKILEARGLVSIQHGKGSFIADSSKENMIKFLADSLRLTLITDEKLLLELVYVRRIIEASVAADVASTRTDEDLYHLSEILAALEKTHKAHKIEDYNRLDALFHKAIIDAAGNRILSALYDRMINLILTSFKKTGYLRGSTKDSIAEHRKILEYIQNKDSVGVNSMMSTHIGRTTKSLSRYIKKLGDNLGEL